MKHDTFEDFKVYSCSLSYGHLNPLFCLLPELAKVTDSKIVDTHNNWDVPKIIRSVENEILRLELCPIFDWSSWKEGIALLNDTNTNYYQLHFYHLCKLLTVIYRSDRFNEGYKKEMFTNGTMYKILQAIKANFNPKELQNVRQE